MKIPLFDLFLLRRCTKTATPTIEYADLKVYMNCTTKGAKIHYTLNGTKPSSDSPVYVDPISVSHNCTVKAFAARDSYNASDTVDYYVDADRVTCVQPTVSVQGIQMTFSSMTEGVTFYYTDDGTIPTRFSNVYSEGVVLTHNTVYKVIAVKDGMIDSKVKTFYVDWFQAEQPSFSLNGSMLTMMSSTPNAVIRYELGGNAPTVDSPIYSEPILLTENTVVKAYTSAVGYNDSEVATYSPDKFTVADPVISVVDAKLNITCETPGAKIYYTLDGTNPINSSKIYTGPLTLNYSCAIKAVAMKSGYNNSSVVSFDYNKNDVYCAPPVFSLNGDELTMSSSTAGGKIYYTVDGSTPSVNSIVYSGPITLRRNDVYKAFVTKDGMVDSPVATYTVDWFTVPTPQFSYSDGVLTITSDTPDATIYYTIGGKTPTASSDVYTGPLTLTDNKTVKAIAVAEHFNNSNVVEFTPTDFVCGDVLIAYNGRSIVLTSPTEGATIRYTLDGSDPNSLSYQYVGEILLTENCLVKAVAIKADMNNSSVTSYATPALYDGNVVTVAQAGGIMKAFEWAGDLSTIESLSVRGVANMDDIQSLKTLPNLHKLDMSALTVPGNTFIDYALSDMPNLIYVSMPKSLTSCGVGILNGCNSIAAVDWNAEMSVTSEMLGEAVANPNLLLYVERKTYALSTVQNVVANGIAESIILKDGEGNHNFYCPEEFVANTIQYSHDYKQKTQKTVCRGWETISLPFNVETITHSANGEIAPFSKVQNGMKPFWLYALSPTGFVKTEEIEAYTPYIISMPNDNSYIDEYMLGGVVTFSAKNAKVMTDRVNTAECGNSVFVPNYCSRNKADSLLVINVGQEYNGYLEGSIFIPNLRNASPFEAYLRPIDANHARGIIPIFNIADPTDISSAEITSLKVYPRERDIIIESPCRMQISVMDISGTTIRTVNVSTGVNKVSGLPTGFYIVNRHKVFVK